MPGIADRSRPALAPLDPDAYLTWLHGRPTSVLELWRNMYAVAQQTGMDCVTLREYRYEILVLAARKRRSQRLERLEAARRIQRRRIAGDRVAQRAHEHAAMLRVQPNSYWPQLAGGHHE